jgi:hypothetical protein
LRCDVSPGMLAFLLKLQHEDQAAADALFLKALSRLVAQPLVDGNELLLLGIYVFTSPLEDMPADAIHMVGVGKNAVAEELACNLPAGIERCIIWLAIARARGDEGNTQQAHEALNAALADARRVEGARRPYLILVAAGLLARVDPLFATQTLSESVRAFNAQDEKDFHLISWTSRIEAGSIWRDFPLEVKGVKYDFSEPVSSLLAVDSEGAISILLGLRHEEILSRALRALAGLPPKTRWPLSRSPSRSARMASRWTCS